MISPLFDSLSVENVEFRHAEGRCDLVFHNLDLDAVSVALRAGLEHLGAADVKAHRSVELERTSARRRLGVSVHNADLFAELVYEYDYAVCL